MFRVPWMDDRASYRINRGYRVQFNSAIGPYKGGIRFHPKVSLSTLKFLGFEQIFKNSLTGLPMGGGKGGSDFDPNGKSENEVMRFCQSFMSELFRHVGADTDVPAGDIGVGGREVGYMFGQYKRLANEWNGVLTGKGLGFGGSLVRPEATGFGAIYFAKEMLAAQGRQPRGQDYSRLGLRQRGLGRLHQGQPARRQGRHDLGPRRLRFDPEGIGTQEKWDYLTQMLVIDREKVETYVRKFPKAKFFAGRKPWERKVDIAMPCAIQNELDGEDAGP